MTDGVEKLLEDVRHVSEERYAVVERLRALVLSAGPDVSEEVKYGGVLFSAGSPFCGVFAYAQHVSLELSQGALAGPSPRPGRRREAASAHQAADGGGHSG